MRTHGTRRGGAPIGVLVALALALTLASCTTDESGPTWVGSFDSAISTCGGAQTSIRLTPPLPHTIESNGTFAPGAIVTLFLDDSCPFLGRVAEDGSLHATLHPGCPTDTNDTASLTIRDVFAPETLVSEYTVPADPQACRVEVYGTFRRQ
jgi:hypothetical protein